MVDGLYGPTKDDFEIAHWLKQNFEFYVGSTVHDENSDAQDPLYPHLLYRYEGEADYSKPIPLESGLPDTVKRRKRIRLVASKCDKGEDWDMINDLYSFGFGEPIFTSAQQGDGIHEILREINLMFSPQLLEQYRARKKQRKLTYEKLREEMAQEIQKELQLRNRDFDLGIPK